MAMMLQVFLFFLLLLPAICISNPLVSAVCKRHSRAIAQSEDISFVMAPTKEKTCVFFFCVGRISGQHANKRNNVSSYYCRGPRQSPVLFQFQLGYAQERTGQTGRELYTSAAWPPNFPAGGWGIHHCANPLPS